MVFAEWINLIADLFLIALAYKLVSEIARQGRIPPFIRTRTAVAEEVAEAFGALPAGSAVYDPGCGDGRVLFAIAVRNSHARFVGIELRLFPYLLALLQKRKHPGVAIDLIRGDSFRQDFSSATHLYVYLYPKVMDALLPKLENELRSGTVLISLDFQFSKKEAERTIALASAEKGKLGHTLYVYRF